MDKHGMTFQRKISILFQGIWLLISIIIVSEYQTYIFELDTILLMLYVSAPVTTYNVLAWLKVFYERPTIFILLAGFIQILAVLPIRNGLYGHLEDVILIPMITATVIFYMLDDRSDMIKKIKSFLS